MIHDSPALELINLSKYYGKHRGVIDLNLSVRHGEIFGYVGPNGAGKTTTMRLLLDLLRPTSGSAKILGLDTRSESLAIRRRVGYLSTTPALYGNLTGQEFLRYCSNLKGGCDWSYVGNLTERLDCDINRRIDTLSHGNKQKIAIVRAFMHRPALVILDEPTTGLDPLVQHEFENMLRETVKDGSTILLSSHILSEVEELCDRVAIIREGQLVAVEEISDLKAKQVRTLQITFGSHITPGLFEGIDGVTNIHVDGRYLKCDIIGSLDELIKRASALQVLDIVTQAPSLEDVFLAYYEGQ